MVELPKTEAELQAIIDEKVKARENELKAEHDNAFANQRKKYEDEIRKTKENAGKTAEELAEQKIKEQQEKDQLELNELRTYKKSKVIEERLAKEKLPSYLKNDTRLLNANDENEFEKALKDVKKDYDDSIPKGSRVSTVVQTSTGAKPNGSGNTADAQKEEAYSALAETLGGLIGK